MKKRLTAFIFVLLLVIIPVNSFAFQSEPTGFRGVYFGESISSVMKKYTIYSPRYEIKENADVYISTSMYNGIFSKSTKIAGYDFDGAPICDLYFWKDKLYRIELMHLSYNDKKTEELFWGLKNSLTKQYGTPIYYGYNNFGDLNISVDGNPDNLANGTVIGWGKNKQVWIWYSKDPEKLTHIFVTFLDLDLLEQARNDAASLGW